MAKYVRKPTDQVFPHVRVGEDGSLNFPRRGNIPKCIQGYLKDRLDPCIFHPLIKPCLHREVTWRKECGGMVQSMYCKHFVKDVGLIHCLDCLDRKEK